MAIDSIEDPKAAIQEANAILRSKTLPPPKELLKLVERLHDDRKFGLARQILELSRDDSRVTGDPQYRLPVAQKLALSTYKDPDLRTYVKLEQALNRLQQVDDLSKTENQKTLGLAGALYKRLWELTTQERYLITALAYYRKGCQRGYQQDAASDYGCTAINTAFVLDLLADLETPAAGLPDSSGETVPQQRRQEARAIREKIVEVLSGKPLKSEWWFLVTLGEAYFGLKHYKEAEPWLRQARDLEVPDWDRESTARRFATLWHLQQRNSRARQVLRTFLNDSEAAVTSMIQGKIGLALSGGGFRASLYHIGVLARLAELDLLRHVEYLSCVSGGSIVGAHYYLEVRKLLKEKADQCDLRLMVASDGNTEEEMICNFKMEFESKKEECAVLIVRATSDSDKRTLAGFDDAGEFRRVVIEDPNHELSKELKEEPINENKIVELAILSLDTHRCIKRQDYIEIVKRISETFLAGVKRNIRTRIAADWKTHLKMMFCQDYSRTRRAGELYEQEIYSRVLDDKKRWLHELKIVPKGESERFKPKDRNWRRSAKVPILILNATTLNTGHNWQFTATWMGEPPADIDSEVDANYRLRRMYYQDEDEKESAPHRRMRLGHAVAASACVPGIFEPLSLVKLYERYEPMSPADDYKVRPIIVRLVDGGVHDNQGVASLLEQGCSVLLVSDASGQTEAQDVPKNGLLSVPLRANSILQTRVRVSQFEDLEDRRRGGLLKGLMFVHLKKGLEPETVNWIDYQDPSRAAGAGESQAGKTAYGVQKSIQRLLAAIRTDLDSFSEVEAYALMADGYLMTKQALDPKQDTDSKVGPNYALGFKVEEAPRGDWPFLQIESLLQQAGTDNPLLTQLKVADKHFFKVWLLLRWLKIAAGVLALSLLVLLVYAISLWWSQQIFSVTVGGAVLAVVPALGIIPVLGIVFKILNYRKTVQEMLIGLGTLVIGVSLARLHLCVFDRLFLCQGRLKRLLRKVNRRDRFFQAACCRLKRLLAKVKTTDRTGGR